MIGTIKSVIKDKGFGFIECEQLGMDIFFHKSVCNNFAELSEKQPVDFDYVAEKKGLRATTLKPVKTSEKLTSLGKIVMVKTGTPSDIRSISGSFEIKSEWYRSPDDAYDCIQQKARDVGCNVITLLKCERDTVTLDSYSGYKGTVHRYTGMALVGMRSKMVPFDESLEEENKLKKSSAINTVRNAEQKIKTQKKASKHSDVPEIILVLKFGLFLLIIIPVALLFFGR